MILSSCLHACFFNTVFSSRSRRYLISDQIDFIHISLPILSFFLLSIIKSQQPVLQLLSWQLVNEPPLLKKSSIRLCCQVDLQPLTLGVKMSNLRLPDALELPDTEGGHQLPGSQLRTEPQTLSLGSCRRPESSKNLFNIRYPRSNLSLDDLVCKIIIIYQNTHHSWQDPAPRQRASKTLLRSPRL